MNPQSKFKSWLLRLLQWLFEEDGPFIRLAVPPAVLLVAILVESDWELRFQLTGMCLQLLGLAITARGIQKNQNLFDIPKFLNVLRNWLARRPKYSAPDTHAITGHVELGIGIGSVMTHSRTPLPENASAEDRILRLEEELDATNKKLVDAHYKIASELGQLRDSIIKVDQGHQCKSRKLENLIQNIAADGTQLEITGVVWIAVGIVLTSLATVWASILS